MHVLVTDCGGLIGPSLIRWLLANSDAVVVGTNERHERLSDLLEAPRFTFYVAASGEYDALARDLLDHTDVVVSLAAVEYANALSPAATEARADLIRSCAALKARLIYVTTAEAATGVSDGLSQPASGLATPRLSGETERLIVAHGTIDQLDYVIVRTFGIITDHLDIIPASQGGGVLTRLRRALLGRNPAEIPIEAADRIPRAFVALDDAAEWLGRLVLDQGERTTREVLDLACPANSASPADVAQIALARFSARHWNGRDPLPRLARQDVSGDPVPSTPAPDTAKAVRLVGWRPHRPLNDVIDVAIEELAAARSDERTPEAS